MPITLGTISILSFVGTRLCLHWKFVLVQTWLRRGKVWIPTVELLTFVLLENGSGSGIILCQSKLYCSNVHGVMSGLWSILVVFRCLPYSLALATHSLCLCGSTSDSEQPDVPFLFQHIMDNQVLPFCAYMMWDPPHWEVFSANFSSYFVAASKKNHPDVLEFSVH